MHLLHYDQLEYKGLSILAATLFESAIQATVLWLDVIAVLKMAMFDGSAQIQDEIVRLVLKHLEVWR